MFTIKAYHVNPINAICLTLLTAILVLLLVSGKPSASQDCPYEKGECPNVGCSNHVPANPYYKMRDYQIQISDDQNTLIIFDGDRVVGTYPLRWNTMLGKMILIDND